MVAPAEAAHRGACVTAGEYRALKVGASKARVTRLLDGKGTKVDSRTRRYSLCGSGAHVHVAFNRGYAKKKAAVAAFWTQGPDVEPPAAPPAQPVAAPPTTGPTTTPAIPPTIPLDQPVATPPTVPTTPQIPGPPAPVTVTRSVVDAVSCQALTVVERDEKRTNWWAWDGAAWVESWSLWQTVGSRTRAATAKDCVNLVDVLSSDVLLPDLRIKNLDKCGGYDLSVTNGTCFKIVNPAPHNHDFPLLEGRKLLKFPVITMNVGAGPSEVIADRSGSSANDWKAFQTFYRPNGDRESRPIPEVQFYFAGDGHQHWHFKDFDSYWIENLDGGVARTAEKHGYCIQDNTRWNGLSGEPRVPAEPVYAGSTSCGAGLPNSLTFIQGVSRGWGDTYDTSLPDQAIDITDLPDGRYRVGITADILGAVRESDDSNNTATMEISISGNTVTTYPSTATGGLS